MDLISEKRENRGREEGTLDGTMRHQLIKFSST